MRIAAVRLRGAARAPCARALSSLLRGAADEEGFGAVRERRRRNPILGPNLPDVWRIPNLLLLQLRGPPISTPAVVDPAKNEHRATLIDGKAIAEKIRSGIAQEVCRMKNTMGKVPCLAVVLVGQRKDSQSYVHYKAIACQEVGIKSLVAELPEHCTERDIIEQVSRFNTDPTVHGVLVQLPLPRHVNEENVVRHIDLEKDVDGFHPLNMGNLAMSDREPLFIPCASQACIELLLHSGMDLLGKNVTVIGRSNIVGLPTSLLLQRHHATVTVIHALTKNPEEVTRKADIVISAAGVANLVRGNWLKKGAIVIDVGTNPVEDANEVHGYRLIGDVCYEEAVRVASMITPVPGGVGPMTIAMLLSSTLNAAKRLYGLE